MIRVSGGGGSGYPGVTADGQTPAGLNVDGRIVAAVYGATDPDRVSGLTGGMTVNGQGVTSSPAQGNWALDTYWNDAGIARAALRVIDDGTIMALTPLRLHAHLQTNQSAAHTLGAYSGNALAVYAEDGTTILGYLPLYA